MSLYYRTPQNYDPEVAGTTNDQPSMTLEGETQSIEEILTKGTVEEKQRPVSHIDAGNVEEITGFYRNDLDLSDIQRLQESINRRHDQLDAQLEELEDRREQIEVESEDQQEKESEEEEE